MDFKYPTGATPLDPDETGGLLLSHITLHPPDKQPQGDSEGAFKRTP